DGATPSAGEQSPGHATSKPGEQEVKADAEVSIDEKTAGPFWPALDFQNTGPGSVKGTDQASAGLDVPGCPTKYLIACVPDPHDSSSGSLFDSVIDAIQRAFETQHYVLDRYFYPWPHKGRAKASPIAAPAEVDVQGALALEGQGLPGIRWAARGKSNPATGRTDPKRWPGVLLFRARPELGFSPALYQVFLVGETATAGLHKEAFTVSLDLIGKSHKYLEGQDHHTVRILGPYFSGSQVSLERTLSDWVGRQPSKSPSPTFTIVSGSATAIEKKKL